MSPSDNFFERMKVDIEPEPAPITIEDVVRAREFDEKIAAAISKTAKKFVSKSDYTALQNRYEETLVKHGEEMQKLKAECDQDLHTAEKVNFEMSVNLLELRNQYHEKCTEYEGQIDDLTKHNTDLYGTYLRTQRDRDVFWRSYKHHRLLNYILAGVLAIALIVIGWLTLYVIPKMRVTIPQDPASRMGPIIAAQDETRGYSPRVSFFYIKEEWNNV